MAQQIDIVANLLMKVDGAEAGINKLKNSLSKLKMPEGLENSFKKSFANLDTLFAKYKSQVEKGFETKGDITAFNKTSKALDAELTRISKHFTELTGKEINFKVKSDDIIRTEKELEKLIEQKAQLSKESLKFEIKGGKDGFKDVESILLKLKEAAGRTKTGENIGGALDFLKSGDVQTAISLLEKASVSVKRFKQEKQDAFKSETGFDMNNILTTMISMLSGTEGKFGDVNAKIIETKNNLTNFQAEQIQKAGNYAEELSSKMENSASEIRQADGAMQDFVRSSYSMSQQLGDLQQSTQYFFSLRNMINLLKRGIDDAVQSVKELDKAMTETAVVTDYKVSDLWGMLPEYTQLANQLGATTQGAYETMTLYFQQGLDQQQAFELGAETMKMARIAGLDYAETTDMMTAALRGFNMELNETSAKRVNDVYSELAAITASDTEELGTAMQRTASIAASAGASFEGTTAFLAQAIETTREPAENIGTAMKTIVARFQELKKNPLEISEVDGEEVDYNKIDAALKTIGVDLKDTNGQFRDFDQVMLDISAKWNTLSQAQQRYIATTAAGSRQQSRFIAMVSNYDRTMQLMEAANNSAGASDEQFGKTMDSLESKLNQLHNAWQAFTMGIANNGMIKLAVDGLTNFLTVTNKIIDTLSMGSGTIKSFLSIFAAFTGLKAAGRIANRAIGGLGGLIDPQSTFKEGFKGGAVRQGQNQAQAKAISTPIVNSLNKISQQIAQIKNGKIGDDSNQSGQVRNTSKQEYLDIKKQFDKLSGKEGFKIDEASSLFGQLDAKHQQAMFNNSPGTKAAMKKASMAWFDSRGLSKELTNEGKQYINSIYKGMEQGQIPVDKGEKLIGRPDLWGEHFATDAAKAFSDQYAKNLTINESDLRAASEAMIEQFSTEQMAAMSKEDYSKQADKLAQEFAAKRISKGHGETKGTVTNMGRFANDIGAVADKFTQAGYGITAFGNALSQLSGPLGMVGNGIATFGSAISTIGMSISGATGIISLFTVGITDATGAVVVAGSTIAAVAAPLAALAAGFLLVRHHIKQVKEAGAEVTETFNESNKAAEDNIAKLKSYQGEFAILSKGVDSNGNNVNLDDAQYQRYLEIVKDIAAINPTIVDGYNAQGHAIINNNKALAETLRLQEQNQKKAFEEYTSTKALQKLINARNISSEYKNNIINPTSSKAEDAGLINSKRTPFAADVRNIASQLSLTSGIKDFDFTKYGIDSLDALKNGEEKAVQNFVKHRQQIEADLGNSGVKLSDAAIKGFNTLGDNVTAFDEAIKPVYDNLLTNVSNSSVFKSIAPEFREALQTGLKDLASQDLSAPEMTKAANDMAARFANLTSGSGKYKDALDIVEKAQDNFAATLNETEYKAEVQPAIDELTRLKEEALNEGSAYGDALAEYLENQIERISRFTEEGSISLSEALNTATNEIAAAEGAYDSFKEATKSDFATGAESMKSIFDEITKETDGIALHMQGKGDKAFWTGAESLFGADALVDKTPEQVKKMFDRIQPMLQEGQAGFDAFWTDVFSNENVEKLNIEGLEIDPENWMLNWDDNVNPEVFHEMAQALGMSDEFLTSMLNKGRQFGAIDFMDTNDVRKALSTDVATVKGTSTTKTESGQVTDMFVKGDYLRSALRDAGMVTPQDQQEAIDRLTSEGVHIIKDPDQISTNDLKGMGITDMASAIKILGDTGQYTKDEIQAYAEKLGDYTPEDFADGYQQYLDAQEHPEIEPIQSIQATVEQIASLIASQQIQEGHLADTHVSEDFKRAIYGEANKRNTQAQLFSQGKNEQGNIMTAQQYQFNLAELQKAQVEAQNYINTLTSGMKNASGQDLENMKAEKASMEATLSHLNDQINQGRQNWAEAYAQQQYDMAYQSALDAGANVKTTQEEAAQVKLEAQQKAEEIVKAAEEGMNTGFASSDTSGVKQAGQKTAEKYTDTGTGGPSTGSTITNAVKFVTEGAEEAKQQVDDISTEAEKPSTKEIKFDTSDAGTAKNEIKKVADTGTGGQVKVGASLDSGATSKIASAISGTKANIPVGIKDNASSAAEKVRQTIDNKKATIDVSTSVRGQNVDIYVTKHVKTAATGMNNKIAHYSLPILGSLAKGSKYGRLGPRGKGGLTLTGEEGFEVAWIPSESRSLILGAEGPQMINLPSDAVVYTHEQSEDILRKRQTIDAGSLSSGNASYTLGGGSSKKSKKKKTKKKSKKKSKSSSSKETINNFSIQEVVRFNIDKNLTTLTNQIEDRTKSIEKTLAKIGTRYKDIVDNTKKQVAALNEVKNKNQALYNSYAAQLKEYRGRQEVVSYTNSKGESKQKKINVSTYLNADGSINQAAISKLGTREEREAVYKQVSSVAKTLIDGMNSAQKAIDDAQDKINDLGKQVSEVFYQWENELTEVYDLAQRINNEVSFTDRFASQLELELSKLNAGFGDTEEVIGKTAESIGNIRSVLIRSNNTIQEQIKDQQQMIAARQRELEAALSYQDEVDKLNKFINTADDGTGTKQANIEWAQGLANGATLGFKYVKNLFKDIDGSIKYEIDWEQFNKDNEANPYTKDTYEAIKKYLDDLNNAATEFNNSIKEQTDFIKQTYDALREYQDYVADMEDTLIKGVEEQIEEAKNNAKQLSDSITSALKDLLDEVKRKLDERRKQEDNTKTERDISQKQQRLAALRADTSGGHQVEIAQLEKEIADAQQSYQRTLEDQLLDRLQQQADEAAKQRERQIELMEAGNEIDASTNKELVDLWLKNPQAYKEEIRNAWLEANGYYEKGEAGQYILENQFESAFAELVTAVEQSGFNNLKQPFTAIEGNTNTLVYLLTQLTNGQLGRYDTLSLGEDQNDALVDATERNTETLEDLTKDIAGAKKAKQSGIDAKTLKDLGFSAESLVEAGYEPKELRNAGFTANELYGAGITDAGSLHGAGYSAAEVKNAGNYDASTLKNANFTAKELVDLFSLDELVNAAFDAKSLKEAGFKSTDLKSKGFDAKQLKEGGYDLKVIKNAGYTAQDFKNSGLSFGDARNAGFTLPELQTLYRQEYQAAVRKAAEDSYWAALKSVKALKPASVKTSHVDNLLNLGSKAGRSHAQVLLDLVGGAGGSDPFTWKNIFKAIIDSSKIDRYELVKTWPNGDGTLVNALKTLGNPDTLSEIKKHKNYKNAKNLWNKYSTGGLANYTGPAWLDGTPSKPELVLNSTDTKNFLALRDVLSSAMKSTSSVNNSYGGDATYEININVDHLNNDYDVDKVAERVKKIIVKDAGYRNVTQVRNLR